jgi:serine/threonine protein kinase
MATVFKAYHLALDRYVALKVLNPVLKDPSFLHRFRREARFLGNLDHPNIVPIYDFSEHDGQPYLVMKYIEGDTLMARIARANLSSAEILDIVEAVGNALIYAHSRGILHRDIKPSNILIEQQGHVYLADFGIARMMESKTESLTGDMIVGTPQYISPEQALGSKTINEGTDIYSFGIILFEMTVGCVPYNESSPVNVLQKHINAPLPQPSLLNPEITPAMDNMLLKALAKQPEDRFSNVGALVCAFRDAWLEMHDKTRVGTACLQATNGMVFPLAKGAVTLGRSSDTTRNFVEVNLISLDANRAVSRQHARIELKPDGYYLSDLGSTNGTAVNGAWLQPNSPVLLKDGDEIIVGKRGVALTVMLKAG